MWPNGIVGRDLIEKVWCSCRVVRTLHWLLFWRCQRLHNPWSRYFSYFSYRFIWGYSDLGVSVDSLIKWLACSKGDPLKVNMSFLGVNLDLKSLEYVVEKFSNFFERCYWVKASYLSPWIFILTFLVLRLPRELVE